MTDLAFLEQLKQAIALTGVQRYEFLCLEHPNPQVRAGYQRLVTEIVNGVDTGQRYEPSSEPARPCGGCPGNPYG